MSPYFHPQEGLENKIQMLVSETKGSDIFGGGHEYRHLKLSFSIAQVSQNQEPLSCRLFVL